MTNTYTTRTISGTSAVGCFYDVGGCIIPSKIKVTSNTTFKTAQTYLNPYFDDRYFFGMNHFIVYHEYADSTFTTYPYTDPLIKMSFDTVSSTGNDVYSTDITFTGNPFKMFSLKFGYLIDVSSDCPATGNIYHINSYQCDSSCPWYQYENTTNNYCYGCNSRCQGCTGPSNNQCTGCNTAAHHRILNGTTCVCQPLYYYDNLVSDICPPCSYTCLTCFGPSNSNCLSCNFTDIRYDDGNNSCPCNPGWYDNGGSTCVKCDITCVTCYGGAGNNCITCPDTTTTFRIVSGTSCPCMAGYYHASAVICSLCHYSCQTCTTSATNCVSCNAS